MASDKKGNKLNRIPVRFLDPSSDTDASNDESSETQSLDSDTFESEQTAEPAYDLASEGLDERQQVTENDASETVPVSTPEGGGPEIAELVATRAELRRVESEVAELKDRLARRQAEFENYRKRVERERAETYDRVVADLAAKLLPVVDNLKRALDAEASVEAAESDEFRHFLSGVDLIYRQLSGVLDALGVKSISAVGEHFNPHLHEAVLTEPTEEYEPDTVIQEIVRGYMLGDKLIRPSLVKVAVKK